jgi:hypothetical protein
MPAPGHGKAFSRMFAPKGPGLGPVCHVLRRLIQRLDRDCVEVDWPRMGIASFGVGPRKMTEHYAYLSAHAAHVNLGFYHGASLRDPEGLLEGTGRRLRHVKIRGMADARRPAVRRLLARAIAERRGRAAP